MERWSNREKIVVRRVLKQLKGRIGPPPMGQEASPVYTLAETLAAEWGVDLTLPSPDPRMDGRRPRRRRPRRDNAVAQAARPAG